MATRSRVLILGVIAGGTAAAMYAYGQNLTTLGLKPGEWEFTSVAKVATPFGDVGNLPPAVQQAIKRMQEPHTYDKCITAEDMANFDVSNPDDDVGKCKITSQTANGTTIDVQRTCGEGDDPTTQKIHVNALSSTRVEATVDITSSEGTSNVALTATWLGASCKGD